MASVTFDSREVSKSYVQSAMRLLEGAGIDVSVDVLPFGDVKVRRDDGEVVYFELKRASGLIADIRSGRLQEQIRRAGGEAFVVVVLDSITGFASMLRKKAGDSAAEAAMRTYLGFVAKNSASLSVVNVPIRYLGTFLLYSTRGGPKTRKISKPRYDTLADAQVELIAGIPGVGAERAKRLLRKFGTPAAVAAAEESELTEVEGIGPKTAERILAVFHTPHTEAERVKIGTTNGAHGQRSAQGPR